MIAKMFGQGQERFSRLPQSSTVQRLGGMGGRQIPERGKLWYNRPLHVPTVGGMALRLTRIQWAAFPVPSYILRRKKIYN